jgi:UDP-N-acetylglucosamine 1-carboxyvinyltransferase
MSATDSFLVQGKRPLGGTLQPQGAKNEALQILSAVLLSADPITIHNIPDIIDIRRHIELLAGLGVKVTPHLDKHSITFQADDIDLNYLNSPEFRAVSQRIRGSVMLIGPLLARFGKAYLPKPGGDKIGRRHLDTHFLGFKMLGAEFHFDTTANTFYAAADRLKGTFILMEEISVTGTANILMAAVLAEGKTTIYNAACEPYLQQLSEMLVRMGAKIGGIGSNMLTIEGVDKLGGTTHTILPDMIEIGSFIGLAAMTQSNIRIKDCRIDKLGVIPNTFRKLGIDVQEDGDDLFIPEQDIYEIQTYMDGSILTIYDSPWPGFTPDLMSIILVASIHARGSILVHQKMFESRLFFVDKLIDMGAKIILCDPHRATVIGSERKYQLRGIEMSSPDIRAGVALLIAALSAKGQSTIHNISQIERGYENIDGRLNAIGAEITRV